MTWIPSWIPKWVISLLPYLVVALIIAGGVWKYNHDVESARVRGYDAGVAYQKGVTETDTLRARQENEDEKERIERQTQARLDAAIADRNLAIANSDRMHQQLDKIRSLAEQYTGAQSVGVSTGTVIRLLTDLLEESQQQYLAVATEADAYYNAGLTCQLQYESLRRKIDETNSSSTQRTAASY